jgi:uncharacterized protein YegJ (DUF2314 family)
VTFKEAAITDWMIFLPDGALGSFTTRAMLPSLPPAIAAEQAAMLAKEPVPQSWKQ